jgi:hypothetical protein
MQRRAEGSLEMAGNRDLFSLHPFAAIASLGAAGQESAADDAEPEPERQAIHRRLLAVVRRRLDSPQAPSTRSERAF